MNKGCEAGPTVYHPYPRRLESPTICRCYYKGSILSSPLCFTFFKQHLTTVIQIELLHQIQLASLADALLAH